MKNRQMEMVALIQREIKAILKTMLQRIEMAIKVRPG